MECLPVVQGAMVPSDTGRTLKKAISKKNYGKCLDFFENNV